MKKLFIPYELALIAKDKGFNESCFGGYYLFENKPDLCIYQDENEFSDSKEIILQAPLYQQMVDWFSEKHKIQIVEDISGLGTHFTCKIWNRNLRTGDCEGKLGKWTQTYPYALSRYEALNLAIEEALKLI